MKSYNLLLETSMFSEMSDSMINPQYDEIGEKTTTNLTTDIGDIDQRRSMQGLSLLYQTGMKR